MMGAAKVRTKPTSRAVRAPTPARPKATSRGAVGGRLPPMRSQVTTAQGTLAYGDPVSGPAFDSDGCIWESGFPKWSDVGGRVSVADLFPPSRRCGIYVLGFSNGDRYVGRRLT